MLPLSPLRSWFVRLRERHCLALERLSVGGILVWIVLAGILACLVLQPFVSLQRAALADMRERLAARTQELDAKLGEVAYQVDSQRNAAETLLLHSESLIHSPLNSYLKTTPDGSSFGLARVPLDLLPQRVGNLYGRGRLDMLGQNQRRELDMALALFPLHRATLRTTPELAWVYYVSASDLYAVSPWVSDTRRTGHDTLGSRPKRPGDALLQDAFLLGTPKHNPEHKPYWTGLYADPSGNRLLVTHGAPVYQGSVFHGVVAADLSLNFLSRYLEQSGGVQDSLWLLVENSSAPKPSQLIAATGFSTHLGEPSGSWQRYLKDRLGIATPPQTLPVESWAEADGYYILSLPLTTVPWSMVYLLPRTQLFAVVFAQLKPAFGLVLVLLALLTAQTVRLWRAGRLVQLHGSTDPLTGVGNRGDFFAKAQKVQARHKRRGLDYSLVLCDLDHFKVMNERYGHNTGDWLLKTVAEGLEHHLREQDLFARLDGDEFACLLVETGCEQAQETARSLCRQVASTSFILPGGPRLSATASFGVVTCVTPDEPIELLIQRAKVALYRAKTLGRNGVEYEPAQPLLPFDSLPFVPSTEQSEI